MTHVLQNFCIKLHSLYLPWVSRYYCLLQCPSEASSWRSWPDIVCSKAVLPFIDNQEAETGRESACSPQGHTL